MPFTQPPSIVSLLLEERNKLDRAIEALGHRIGPRRGRPPKNPQAIATASALPAKRGRRTFTLAQRKAQAAKMRAYWATRRLLDKKQKRAA